MRPIFIPKYIQQYLNKNHTQSNFDAIASAYQTLTKGREPEVSIVMPAYNEEENIVQTLSSLCHNNTSFAVEIVVVNNNSKDKTEELIKACGVICAEQTIQGITPTRNKGLSIAKGKYILNADADTIYPKDWIEEMIKPLATDNNAAITYGTFSFIPIGSTGRFTYYFYEWFSEFTRFYNAKFKTEAVNVYGFNSGFRKEQGLQVDGFNHPAGTNEDGFLALKLTEKGFGKMHRVGKSNAIVWTTDRRIQIDGGLWKGTWKRLKRVFNL
ncbi:glycosyltransferase family A protein [Mucilaginibacter gynuensis]|uniref:Glycosyltransferase family A protein n=1 Tax=Mucilaginibacter gynuensis TaxID=1302236 RepID=A0ABP8G2C6_9SPHI